MVLYRLKHVCLFSHFCLCLSMWVCRWAFISKPNNILLWLKQSCSFAKIYNDWFPFLGPAFGNLNLISETYKLLFQALLPPPPPRYYGARKLWTVNNLFYFISITLLSNLFFSQANSMNLTWISEDLRLLQNSLCYGIIYSFLKANK